jgi:mRNA-degrading endonuclease RelE of RelBE toxin-antitoxin system
MGIWTIHYEANWDIYFNRLDQTIQSHIFKKINKLQFDIHTRHFRKLNFFISEVGQYRIAFFENKETKTRTIVFVGNHTQYEKWYKSYL